MSLARPDLRMGISSVDHWIRTGAWLLLERAVEFPFAHTTYPSYNYLNPKATHSILLDQRSQASKKSGLYGALSLEVTPMNTPEILQALRESKINAGIVEPETRDLSLFSDLVIDYLDIHMPGLTRLATIPGILVVDEPINQAVLEAIAITNQYIGLEGLIARILKTSTDIAEEAEKLKNKFSLA